MSFFPRVAVNTLSQLGGRGAVVLLSIAITSLLTRLLGLTGYGNYVFIISLILLFVTLSDWGTSLIFIREAVKNLKEEGKFYGNALLIRLFFSFIFFSFIQIVSFLMPQFLPLSGHLRIASFLLFLISLKTSFHIIFQTKLKFEYIALVDVVNSFFFLILIFLSLNFLKIDFSLSSLISIFVLANLVSALFAYLLSRRLSPINLKLDLGMIKKILSEAMPTGALLVTFSIYNRLDIFLLKILSNSEAVGVYGLAYKIHDNLILAAAYLTASLFPILSNLLKNSKSQKEVAVIYKKSFDLLFMIGFLVLAIIILFARPIIFLVGGEPFSGSVLALRILVFATVFSYFNHLTGYTLIALGKQRVSLIIAIMALIWNVSLNLIFIPQYSYIAAAIITITTEGFVLVLTSFYLAKKHRLFPSLNFINTFSELIKTRGKIF